MKNLTVSINVSSIEVKKQLEKADFVFFNEKTGKYLLPSEAIGIDLSGYSCHSQMIIKYKPAQRTNAEKRQEKEINLYNRLISKGYTKKDLSKFIFPDVTMKVVSIVPISAHVITETLEVIKTPKYSGNLNLIGVLVKHNSYRSNSKTLNTALKVGQVVTAKTLQLEKPIKKTANKVELHKPEYIASKYLRLK